jgi:hypothetical protein
MEKIFDNEVIEYLKESGVSQKEIYKIQYDKLKEGAIKRLTDVVSLIEDEEFIDLKRMLSESPSGDGYGCDNYFIDFINISSSSSMDIMDVLMYLEQLKKAK